MIKIDNYRQSKMATFLEHYKSEHE